MPTIYDKTLTLDDFIQLRALLNYEQAERDRHIQDCQSNTEPVLYIQPAAQPTRYLQIRREINPQASLQSSLERARLSEALVRLKWLKEQYKRQRALEVQLYLEHYRRQALIRSVLEEEEEMYYRQCIAAAVEQARIQLCMQQYLDNKQQEKEEKLEWGEQHLDDYGAYHTEKLENVLQYLFNQQNHEEPTYQKQVRTEEEQAKNMAQVWQFLSEQKENEVDTQEEYSSSGEDEDDGEYYDEYDESDSEEEIEERIDEEKEKMINTKQANFPPSIKEQLQQQLHQPQLNDLQALQQYRILKQQQELQQKRQYLMQLQELMNQQQHQQQYQKQEIDRENLEDLKGYQEFQKEAQQETLNAQNYDKVMPEDYGIQQENHGIPEENHVILSEEQIAQKEVQQEKNETSKDHEMLQEEDRIPRETQKTEQFRDIQQKGDEIQLERDEIQKDDDKIQEESNYTQQDDKSQQKNDEAEQPSNELQQEIQQDDETKQESGEIEQDDKIQQSEESQRKNDIIEQKNNESQQENDENQHDSDIPLEDHKMLEEHETPQEDHEIPQGSHKIPQDQEIPQEDHEMSQEDNAIPQKDDEISQEDHGIQQQNRGTEQEKQQSQENHEIEHPHQQKHKKKKHKHNKKKKSKHKKRHSHQEQPTDPLAVKETNFPPIQDHVLPLQKLIQTLASEPILIGEQQTQYSDEPKPSGIWTKENVNKPKQQTKSPPLPPLSTQNNNKTSFLPQHVITEAEPTPTKEQMPNTPIGAQKEEGEQQEHFVNTVAAEQKNEIVPPDPRKLKMYEELETISRLLTDPDSDIVKRWKNILQGGKDGKQTLDFSKQKEGTLLLTATTPFNRQFLGSEDELVRTMLRLDAVDSYDDPSIREERKKLVKTCESMLDDLDHYKQSQWEKAMIKNNVNNDK